MISLLHYHFIQNLIRTRCCFLELWAISFCSFTLNLKSWTCSKWCKDQASLCQKSLWLPLQEEEDFQKDLQFPPSNPKRYILGANCSRLAERASYQKYPTVFYKLSLAQVLFLIPNQREYKLYWISFWQKWWANTQLLSQFLIYLLLMSMLLPKGIWFALIEGLV